MARLSVAFPYPAVDRQRANARARLYREHLGHLSDELWLRVVDEAVEHETEATFPLVAVLLSYVQSARAALSNPTRDGALLLPPGRRTEAEKAAARAEARRQLEQIKAQVSAALESTPLESVQSISEPAATVVYLSDERAQELAKQARDIANTGPADRALDPTDR